MVNLGVNVQGALAFSQLYAFIQSVDMLFSKPLSQRVDLLEYSQKLFNKATLCYILQEGKVIALTAGYTQQLLGSMAYISLVATLPENQGAGLACETVTQFIKTCRNMNLSAIHLYTTHDNEHAKHLYEKLGFRQWNIETEPRPEDLHMILYLKKEGSD